jgi:hypothetical protein
MSNGKATSLHTVRSWVGPSDRGGAVPEEMEEAMGGWVLVMVACRAAGGSSKLVMKVKADHRLLGPRDKSEKWYSGFIF